MLRIQWLEKTSVPRLVGAVLDSLRMDIHPVDIVVDAWPDLRAPDTDEWDRAIYYLNRNQLTLIARHVCRERLPEHVQDRFDRYYRANSARLSRLRTNTSEVLSELARAGAESVLLKGFARITDYVPDADARMHYDIDLYCPHSASQADSVLRAARYEPLAGAESDAACHLVPLARATSWKWRDDFFDLETPVHVELHDRLWAPEIERIAFSDLADFWDRREKDIYCTLSRHDTLAHRCLHLLRHVLRGDVRAAGVYEIAYFLNQNRDDQHFWTTWQRLYADDLRQTQAVCFAMAQCWFGCPMHATALQAVDSLPGAVVQWMEHHAGSPVESFFTPAKHELGLHFALLHSVPDKARVAFRRLLPLRHTARMWEDPSAYFKRLGRRAIYHARALGPTVLRLYCRKT